MLRMLFGANRKVLGAIVSKCATKMLRKYGLNTHITCEDFVLYREGEDLIVHINGEIRVKEEELFEVINQKMDAVE